jgi:hypothetical protein
MGGEGRREPKHPNGELFSVGVEDDERCRWVADTWDGPDAALIALHDPADSIRRYSSALRVLERHTLRQSTSAHLFCGPECRGGDCYRCGVEYPCPDIRDLAASLGLDTEGSTTDGA